MSQGSFPGFGPGIGARLGGLVSNPLITQIFVWQVLQLVVSALLAPEASGVQQQAYQVNPSTPMSVADAVNAAIRGYMTDEEAAHESRNSGIDSRRFKLLLDSAGNPPGVGELLELWRRGVIPEAGAGADSVSYEQGVKEGQTKNKWVEPLKALRYQLPSPQAALGALLEGQTDETTARKLYAEWGGDGRYFDLLFNSQGSAPTPLEAAMMARRGFIPWTGHGAGVVSFEQAFLEGPWRNKWLEPYRQVSEYLPPPRTVTALLRAGSITQAQALDLFRKTGLSEEMAAAYVADASHQATSADRELVKSDVLALYYDRLIERVQAESMLADLHFPATASAWLLDVVEFRQAKALLDHATSRLRGLYVARKIDKAKVIAALDGLGVLPAARDQLLTFWDAERSSVVLVLSPADIAAAVKLGVMSADDGWGELQARGYSADDAAIYLAIHAKVGVGPLAPAAGP